MPILAVALVFFPGTLGFGVIAALAGAFGYMIGRRGTVLLVIVGLLVTMPTLITDLVKDFFFYTILVTRVLIWCCGLTAGLDLSPVCSESMIEVLGPFTAVLALTIWYSLITLVGLACGRYFKRQFRIRIPSVVSLR